jgi:hypothetical protein
MATKTPVVPELSLPQKIIALHGALKTARIPHAFGGALALAYYAEPRATIDIDINLFLAADQFETVSAAVEPLGVDITVDDAALARDGQCRLRWGRTPLDLFFSYDPFHTAMRASTRAVEFADVTIPILSPSHLAACKATFDRPKDWLDIEQMLVAAEAFDREDAEMWIERIAGADSERLQRFRALADEYLG